MGEQTDAVRELASKKLWPIQIIEAENWTLWKRKRTRADWLIIGAHGCSEHEADIEVPNLHATRIYFITQRLVAGPGRPNSWYIDRAFEGGRWSKAEKIWHQLEDGTWRYIPQTENGRIEVFNTAQGELPFDYHLTKYSEHKHVQTITDMYEGGALREFDVITLSKGGANFSEVLAWLSLDYDRHYPNIVAGFCNSTSYSKFITPFGDYKPRRPLPTPPPKPGVVASPDTHAKPLPPTPPKRTLPNPEPLTQYSHGGPPKSDGV